MLISLAIDHSPRGSHQCGHRALHRERPIWTAGRLKPTSTFVGRSATGPPGPVLHRCGV